MTQPTSRTAKNVLANFFGWGWTAAMGLICFPIYVHFLGIEAFGLVGFFTILQSTLIPFDLGLSIALSRELAALSTEAGVERRMRELVRTLEIIYWALAVLVGAGVWMLAPLIARHWVRADHVPVAEVEQAVALMGPALTLVWPFNLYARGVMGLQHHVRLNALNFVMVTLRYLGVVPVLWLVASSVETFFIWQIGAYALHTLATALLLWYTLPAAPGRARFRVERLKEVWRFAAGLSGVAITAVILAQLDKIILSKALPLELLGYYTLASLAAGCLMYISEPLFLALFPRLAQLVIQNDEPGTLDAYHTGCQLLSAIVLPGAAIVALFSPEILFAWSGSQDIVSNTHRILSVLIVAAAFTALNRLPYALQLAHRWTSLAFYANLAAILVALPLMAATAWTQGALGVALVLVLVNACYTIGNLLFMHRRLLYGERSRWYVEDVGYPLAAALLIAGLGRWLFPSSLSRLLTLVALTAVAAPTLVGSLLAATRVRKWALWRLAQWRKARTVEWE